MRIGINGFGRIGRAVFRIAHEQQDMDVVHVNDLMDPDQLATLLQFDTTYGRWHHRVQAEGESLQIGGGTRSVSTSAERDPGALPWRDKGVDVVLEATGVFRKRKDAEKHLAAGARRVLVSAPGRSPLDGDFVIGVNDADFDRARHEIISIGSCTTNCLAPVVKVIHEAFRIQHGLMNTVHAYTASQKLLDGPHKKPRRGRTAALNLVPTSTGAAMMIGKIIPELEGRLHGLAVRAPVPCGSLLDLTCTLGEETSAERVNRALEAAAAGPLAGVLEVEHRPIVSSDVIGTEHSAIVSAQDTQVVGGRLLKVLAWYDNEWAFSRRCVDMMARMA